ncbi:hypothetical protein IJI18_00025 [Candidatus Saccharibacteria bacterium]|nr:hypothetical protein [Candidatus Saccharibacteria bacterium]
MAKVETNDILRYYGVFLDFLNTVGSYQAILKMGVNVEDGVYPVQKVAYEYGYRGAKLDQTIHERCLAQHERLDNLDYWSQLVGFKPMGPDYKPKIIRFFTPYNRRRYVRDNIKRALKKGELLSVSDFIERRIHLEKEKRKKEVIEAGD